jgi:hypothetical protein
MNIIIVEHLICQPKAYLKIMQDKHVVESALLRESRKNQDRPMPALPAICNCKPISRVTPSQIATEVFHHQKNFNVNMTDPFVSI